MSSSSLSGTEKLSRRHFINSFDVFDIKGLTVRKYSSHSVQSSLNAHSLWVTLDKEKDRSNFRPFIKEAYS